PAETKAPSTAAATTKAGWEYKTLRRDALVEVGGGKDVNAGLNKLGEEAWELVAIAPDTTHGPAVHGIPAATEYYFKRPKAAPARPVKGEGPTPPTKFSADDFQFIPLKNASAVEAARTLNQLFQDKGLRIVADPNSNILLVRGPEEQVEVLKRLVVV